MINERYKILKLLGEGRSRVFLCEDTLHGNMKVALKILNNTCDEYETKNFREEYIKLRKFNFPSIVKSFEYGTVVTTGNKELIEEVEKGSDFFTLEYINGVGIRNFYPLNNEKILRKITRQICNTLFYIHESNYIYYDLKPENILVKQSGKNFEIKFIDFGLAEASSKKLGEGKQGTSYFIAPELLLGKDYDKRIDFYSLGVLLYFLMFGKYPFDGKDEIEIYRQKITGEIHFGKHDFSEEFENVVRRLLSKNPRERYDNAYEILRDLKIKNKSLLFTNWKPVKTFQITNTTLEITDFIFRKDTNLILNITGQYNSGKTALAEEIYQNFPLVFWISKNDIPNDKLAWEIILRKIFYSLPIREKMTGEIIQSTIDLLAGKSEHVQQDLTHILNFVTSRIQFVLFLDDFDFYDLFTKNLIENSFTIFAVNRAKLIILTKDKYNPAVKADKIIKQIPLKPFTEYETGEFISKTFSNLFPKVDLTKLAADYTDLLPGNIYDMLKNLFSGEAFVYDDVKQYLKINKNKAGKIAIFDKEAFGKRIEKLNEDERKYLEVISVFPNGVEKEFLSKITGFDNVKIIDELVSKGILKYFDDKIRFTSVLLRKTVYEQIKKRKKLHLKIAQKLRESARTLPRVELAKQFELAGDYEKVFEIILEEIESIKNSDLYGYKKSLLEYIISLAPDENKQLFAKFMLADTLYKLGEFEKSLNIVKEIKERLNGKEKIKLSLLEADCFVAIGKIKKSTKIYGKILDNNPGMEIYEETLLKLATAESYLDLYYQAKAKCIELIKRPEVSKIIKAQAYNLLGILEHDLGGGLKIVEGNFKRAYEIYKELNLPHKLARISINLGNLSNIAGEFEKAVDWWDEALELTQKTGSLEDEMIIRMNYAIYFMLNQQFENAEKYFLRSLKIAEGLNKRYELGLIYLNLSELEIIICEYEKALEHLLKGKDIFEYLGSFTETSEIYFLLAYLHYVIGYKEEFQRYYKGFLKFIESSNNNNKIFLKEFLHLISKSFNGDGGHLNEDTISKINISNIMLSDQIFIMYFYMFILNEFFNKGKSSEILRILNTESFSKLSTGNKLIEAEKDYWMAKISKSKGDKINSLIKFEEGFEKLNDLEITELTWKISIELAEIYFERGNINKATEYLEITENILQIISSKFKHFELKNAYIQNKLRSETLKKIERWQLLVN